MAGLPGAVSATLNNHVLTFLNRSTKIDLAPLKLIDVSTYYEQQFKALKINITNDKCKELAEETEGSPYLMQLLGHYITLKCNDNALFGNRYNRHHHHRSLSAFHHMVGAA